jgi:hypothetical protein
MNSITVYFPSSYGAYKISDLLRETYIEHWTTPERDTDYDHVTPFHIVVLTDDQFNTLKGL